MGILDKIETYLTRYVSFTNKDHRFAASLWVLGTYLWDSFDAFPYLVITSDVKRSGKTRLAEVLGFVSRRPRAFAGMTAAAMFRSIRDEMPTLFIDEAETFSSESATMMRAVLNVGYRRGQTIPRASGKEGIIEWPAYCPKVFVLIGDVYDTLRDRSIIIRMERSHETVQRFVYEQAKLEGQEIRDEIQALLNDSATKIARVRQEIVDTYGMSTLNLSFLNDRDEEIWLSLYAICTVLAWERVGELKRVAIDMSTEKTADVRRYVNLFGANQEADDDEHARRLLVDMVTVTGKAKTIFTEDAIKALRAIDIAPWRKFRGEGLTPINMADLLSRFGVSPKLIRVGGKGRNAKVARGYKRAALHLAARANMIDCRPVYDPDGDEPEDGWRGS